MIYALYGLIVYIVIGLLYGGYIFIGDYMAERRGKLFFKRPSYSLCCVIGLLWGVIIYAHIKSYIEERLL